MRRLGLRTQLAVVALFLGCYSVSIAISYRFENRAQADLELAFARDLASLTRLPRLGDLLRHESLLTQQYLLTGRPEWLAERSRAVADARRLQREIQPLLSGERETELWAGVGRRLDDMLAEQEQWIARRKAGRLSTGSAVELLSRTDAVEELLNLLVSVRDGNAAALQRRREALRWASHVTFWLTLGTGVAVGIVLVVIVSWYLIGPLMKLEAYAREWKLGQPWLLEPPKTGPEIESLFGSLREVSERLNEEYAKELDLGRFKTQLVSMVSHEFNNALAIIGGAALVLEESEGERPEKRKEYYAMLRSNVQALGQAAQNILNMGRLESGRFAISPRRTDPARLLRQCAQRQELLALRKRQHLVFELPEQPLEVKADPDSLALVLTNLIGNAIKYTPEEGRITLRLERLDAEGRARVTIRDTGIGIKPSDHDKVFSGYYRTEQGQGAAKGFGVGLSLAKRIVEAHESVLTLDSDLGKGAAFSFTLPLWKEEEAS